MTTAFSSEVRVLLCSRCGAPIDVPLAGGQVHCRYCCAELTIASRPQATTTTAAKSPSGGTASDEKTRLQRLRLQERAGQASPYDLRRKPEGLEWIARDYPTPAALAGAVPALEVALREEMNRAGSAPSVEAQGRVFYVANVLETATMLAQGDPRRLRAHLESVRDSFTDPGFRQLATCRLAGAARHLGDIPAAEGWLQQCDSASTELPLDTAYRVALAGVQLRQRAYADALMTLGARAGRVPLAVSWKPAAQLFRVEALEKLGQQADADAEYDEAAGWAGSSTWLPAMAAANLDLGDLCAATIARWRASHPGGAEAAERAGVARALGRRRRGLALRWLVLLLAVAIVSWRILDCAGLLDSP